MHTVFRPKSNLFYAGLAIVLDALFVVQFVFYPQDFGSLAVDIAVAILIAAAAYLLWIRPKLVLRETDLLVINPLKTFVIPYADIEELKTKWVLQIDHKAGSIQVWVAPANGKNRWIAETTFRWRNTRVPITEAKSEAFSSMSQSNRSDSGLAAQLIRERMNGVH